MDEKRRVLIIDDDKTVHSMCTPEYEKLGYEVFSLEDGSGDIVGRVIAIKPDVIHLDLIMPGPSGFEILRSLKSDDRTKNIPVFIVSNVSFKEEIQKSLTLGAADHLASAEFDPPELAAKIAGYIPPPATSSKDAPQENTLPMSRYTTIAVGALVLVLVVGAIAYSFF